MAWPSALSSTLLACSAFAVFFACSTADPVYLGTGWQTDSESTPLSCEAGCFLDPALAADDLDLFDEQTNHPAPEVVYPADGTMFPNNLELLSLHFVPSSEADSIFEVRVATEEQERRLYFPCLSVSGGCLYQFPERFWGETARTFAGQTVTVSLRAAGKAGTSETTSISLSFSPKSLRGGLYYWSAELRGLYRLVVGGRQATPYVSPSTEENPGECAGCHAVSRDGSTIAYRYGTAQSDDVFQNAAFTGGLRVALVETPRDPLPASDTETSSEGGGMLTLSSDGSRLVSAFDYQLTLQDTETGEVLDELTDRSAGTPFFPEFSPDDSRLVLTSSDSPDSEIAVRSGGIFVLDVQNDQFGELREVVPSQEGRALYYPTWSPDGEYIAFVAGPGGPDPEEKSYDQASSEIFLVPESGGAPVALSTINTPQGKTTTWPKFAPFGQCLTPGNDTCPAEDRLYFISFSSKRRVGLLANQPGEFRRSQLWMSVISTRKLAEGKDPSSPPFWIPYQSPATRNHLGYWTEVLRCNERLDCPWSFTCNSRGECEPLIR